MNKLKNNYFRNFVILIPALILLISPFLVQPSIVLAQSRDGDVTTDENGVTTITVKKSASQQSNSNPGATSQSTTAKNDPSKNGALPVQTTGEAGDSPEGAAITEALTCSVSGILANAITGAISYGLSKLTGKIQPETPTAPVVPNIVENGVWFGGIQIFPGLNSIAYCLANAMIVYVADSTIAWIQSGFEGKPAFADDPTKLFNDIADYEMSNFLENLGGGFLCEPFEAYVTTNLINSYTNDYSTRGKCTLDKVQGNVESFLTGNSFDYNSYFAVTQNPANNPYGSYLLAEAEARNRIELGIGPVKTELDWGNGYFSWKAKDGPNAGKTVTPGTVIQTQLEQRLGLGTDRLVMAEKFDQVISALVNYLIKTALTETLGTIKGASN